MANEYLDKEGLKRLVELLKGEMSELEAKIDAVNEATANVDHSEYVKFTDIANSTKAGVVKVFTGNHGLNITNGILIIRPANPTEITGKNDNYKPITPATNDLAWKVSATTNTEEWTDEEKAAACKTIGALKPVLPTGSGKYLISIDGAGNVYTQKVGSSVTYNNVPVSNDKGNIKTNTPEEPQDCANKKYVDDNKGTKQYRHEMVFLANDWKVMLVNTNPNKMTAKEYIEALADGNTIARRVAVAGSTNEMGWRDIIATHGKTETQINIVYPQLDGAGVVSITDDFLDASDDYEDTVTEL